MFDEFDLTKCLFKFCEYFEDLDHDADPSNDDWNRDKLLGLEVSKDLGPKAIQT